MGGVLLASGAVGIADPPLIEEVALPKGAMNITTGPDKNMWFSAGDSIGKYER